MFLFPPVPPPSFGIRPDRRPPTSRITIATLIGAVLLALSASASAQSTSTGQSTDGSRGARQEQAREHYARGQRLVAQGRYEEAYSEFAMGYELSERSRFLFNMAECARQAGDIERARHDYQRFLRVGAPGDEADLAQARLAELPPPAPAAEPEAPAPSVLARSEPDIPADLPSILLPLPPPPEPSESSVFEEWPFWTVLISLAALAGVGISLGVHFGTQAPTCENACIDFR